MIKRQEVVACEYGNILREEFEFYPSTHTPFWSPEWGGSQGKRVEAER